MDQVLAVDWSGKAKGAEESIWIARASDHRLDYLRNGLTREGAVEEVIQLAESSAGRTFVGFDFSFGFPAWYARRRGWLHIEEAWTAIATDVDELLDTSPSPFWGRRAGQKAQNEGAPFRVTEEGLTAKSVFQIGGAGAVGTGSLRGMSCLPRLQAAGFAIWPFDVPGEATVVEIYPRLLTGAVKKTSHRARLDYLQKRFAEQDVKWLERAAGSEDAFDAAVSALVMDGSLKDLQSLKQAAESSAEAIEGAIWRPATD